MASMAISSITPSQVTQTAPTVKAAPAQAEPVAKAAVLQPDTVKLSPAAQARMMHREGRSPALIAAMLGTNVISVDGYLNIKVAAQASATPTPAPAEQPAPATQAEQAKPVTPAPSAMPQEPAMAGKG